MNRNALHLAVLHRNIPALKTLTEFCGHAAYFAEDAHGDTPDQLADDDDAEVLAYVGEETCHLTSSGLNADDNAALAGDLEPLVDALYQAVQENRSNLIVAAGDEGFDLNRQLDPTKYNGCLYLLHAVARTTAVDAE